ncbi:hypothetical protein AB0H36_08565 [Kribbella sp. NPDC050820]|uniref:hypothetical protein n=1 Tax=Kribbella sp. NPDC050820 TaxID=3155408 RepID=UPI0033F2C5ED
MKRFVVPPTWPSPPRRSWAPPKTWSPDPSWPPPPEGWRFWVDGKGNPVRGPVGRYGGPTRRAMYAGAGAMVLLLGVNFWALSAIGLFGGDSGGTQAVHVADDSSPTPIVVPPKVTQSTPAPPPVQKTTVAPTRKPTQTPTRQPTKSRTTERESEDRSEPSPTRTSTTTKTVRPPRSSTSTPPSREELLRQYCIQQGYDPEWCDPDNWPTNPADDPRHEEP